MYGYSYIILLLHFLMCTAWRRLLYVAETDNVYICYDKSCVSTGYVLIIEFITKSV